MSEAWFDAEEDLEPAAAAQMGEESKDKRDGTHLVDIVKAIQL